MASSNTLQRLLTNVSALQFYQLFRYGAVILTAILLAKTNLSQEQIGLFETFLFLAGAISFFWTSGIIHSTLSAYPKQSHSNQPLLLFQVFLLLVGGSLFFIGLLILLYKPVNHFLTDRAGTFSYYYPLLLYLLFNVPSFLSEHILLLKKRYRAIVIYGAIVFFGQVGSTVVPVIAGYGLDGAIAGLIVFSALKFLFLIGLLVRYARWTLSLPMLSTQAVLAAPLIGSFFLSGSAEYIDAVIVRHYFDSGDFALFRYGARELPLSLLLANAFSAATVPLVAENQDKAMKAIRQNSLRMMHLLFPLSIVLALVSPFLFPVVFNENFTQSAFIFNIYLLLVITRMLFPQTLLIGMQRTRWMLASSGMELFLNVVLSLLLMQWMGLKGIAIATIIAFLFDKLFLMGVTHFKYNISPVNYTPLGTYFAYSSLLVICFLCVEFALG